MHTHPFIRDNLTRSRDLVLMRIEDMREHCMVFPTPRGGSHTLWTLGHLAFIESEVIHRFMLGDANPLEHWQPVFDGADVSSDASLFPPFDSVLATCRDVRESTIAHLDTLSESDLDRVSAHVPDGFEASFGTYRTCMQFVADHWYMHRGHLACARRAAGLQRMWV